MRLPPPGLSPPRKKSIAEHYVSDAPVSENINGSPYPVETPPLGCCRRIRETALPEVEEIQRQVQLRMSTSYRDLRKVSKVQEEPVLFTAEQQEEYDRYLKTNKPEEQSERQLDSSGERNLVGGADRTRRSMILKMGFQGMLNTSEVVQFNYNRWAYAVLFIVTAFLTFFLIPQLNQSYGDFTAVSADLDCELNEFGDEMLEKLGLVQRKVDALTGLEAAKAQYDYTSHRLTQAQILLSAAVMRSDTSIQVYQDFAVGCPPALDVLNASVIEASQNVCLSQTCESLVTDIINFDFEDLDLNSLLPDVISAGNCVVEAEACPSLPNLDAFGLGVDSSSVVDLIPDLPNISLEDFEIPGNPLELNSTSSFISLSEIQYYLLLLTVIYNSYMLVLLLLAPPLILSKPSFVNRVLLGFLYPSRTMLFLVAIVAIVARDVLREEEFLKWVDRITTDTCQINPYFEVPKYAYIMNSCTQVFLYQRGIEDNIRFINMLKGAAETYQECSGDIWSSFSNPEDIAMASPFPYASPVSDEYDGVTFKALEDINLNLTALNPSEEVAGILETGEIPSGFLKGFHFNEDFELTTPECKIADIAEATYVQSGHPLRVLKIVLLLLTKAVITPMAINFVWCLSAEVFPLAHSRGKAEFYVGTRFDPSLQEFLSIEEYFVLKETSTMLDRLSHRVMLALTGVFLPLAAIFAATQTFENIDASAYEQLL